MTEQSIAMRLIAALCRGDAPGARALFGDTVILDGAFCGRVTSEAGLIWASRCWPSLFGHEGPFTPKFRSTTVAGDHIVSEVWLPAYSPDGKAFDLPFALMVDLTEDGLIGEARYYFCERPLTGLLRHRMTSYPTTEPVASTPADYPDVNARYIGAQLEADYPQIVAQFGAEFYVERGLDVIRDKGKLLEYYQSIILPGVTLRVVKNSGTYDGRTFILEWSSARIPTPSGLAAYERDADGNICALRQYDNSPWPTD